MTDESAAARAAQYLQTADEMQAAAHNAVEPEIVASHLQLAALWLRLAEQVSRSGPS